MFFFLFNKQGNALYSTFHIQDIFMYVDEFGKFWGLRGLTDLHWTNIIHICSLAAINRFWGNPTSFCGRRKIGWRKKFQMCRRTFSTLAAAVVSLLAKFYYLAKQVTTNNSSRGLETTYRHVYSHMSEDPTRNFLSFELVWKLNKVQLCETQIVRVWGDMGVWSGCERRKKGRTWEDRANSVIGHQLESLAIHTQTPRLFCTSL